MSMEFDEEIREFLIESNDNLALLDQEIVLLEQQPDDMNLISSAFRTIHTIKGTCGFFGFDVLGSLTHVTENILSQVRARQRPLTPELITLVLESVDQIKVLLQRVEASGSEGYDDTEDLREKLEAAYAACPGQKSPEGQEKSKSASSTAATDTPSLTPVSPLTIPLSTTTVPQSPPITVPTTALAAPPTQAAPVALLQPAVSAPAEAKATPAKISVEAAESAITAAEGTEKEAQLADSTIRVDVGLLNRLMNLVGELVLARNQLLQETSAQNSPLQQTSQRLNLITSELQEGMMKTRMQPIGTVWGKLPRVVRDLSAKCGKRVHLVMEGGTTELDKTVLEAIKDPLTHIVRNSCDHGIEQPEVRIAKNKAPEGTLLLRAYHEGGVVNIEICDDGAGIDSERIKAKAIERGLLSPEQALQLSGRDALNLIFKPGFSTAAQVTSISGRGVGMDVVKTNVEKIGGSVDVQNRIEGGTTIRIKIPLTLAIIPGLVVTLRRDAAESEDHTGMPHRQERFIVPQANLLELVRLEGSEIAKKIEHVHGTPVFHHRGKLLPLVYLRRVLQQQEPTSDGLNDVINIIVLQAEQRQLGLVVDQIWDTQEIVVKPLGRQLKSLSCYVGATIMGDGRPALILDVAGVSRLAGLGSQTRQLLPAPELVEISSAQSQMLLLFSAGGHERLAVPLALVDRLEEIQISSIEHANGRPVLHYREDILPLVYLAERRLATDASHPAAPQVMHVVVFANGDRRVGLLVDQVVDIVSEKVEIRRPSSGSSLLLGSALIGGKITDLLDLHAVVAMAGENWLDPGKRGRGERRSLLLVDPSPVPRQMLASFLGASGYMVFSFASVAEAIAKLEDHPIELTLLACNLPIADKTALAQAQLPPLSRPAVPVVELLEERDQRQSAASGTTNAILRSERETLLALIAQLLDDTTRVEEAA